MTILCIRMSALGDVAMTIPAIYSCAETFPDHHFLVLTSPFCGRLFMGRPQNVSLLSLDGNNYRGFIGTLRLLIKLRRVDGIDRVADLHNVLRSWIVDAFMWMRGCRVVMLDKRRSERKAILQAHSTTDQPYTERYFDVFRRLGLDCRPTFSRMKALSLPQPESLPTDLLPQALPDGRRKIGIAPFARYANKAYPTAQTEELIAMLGRRDDTDVYLFGSRGAEAELLARWASPSERIHVVAGRLEIEQELTLMSMLDVMLTMDSANMHLASLVGIRVLSLWGSTTPACGFLGYGQQASDALLTGLPCQPCTIAGSPSCHLGTLDCLKALTPQMVADALIEATNKRQQ